VSVEDVVDKVIEDLEALSEAGDEDNGLADIMTIEAVYFGDPLVIPVNSYPCFMVQPIRDGPESETTGYEVLDLTILITLLIDAREFFDSTVLEATGDRELVRAIERVRNHFRRDSKRSLDSLPGIREVKATAAEYNVQVRGGVIAKAAQVTLLINHQRSRRP
jgi:hypothetical protein